jgi:hypothetical protein
MVSTPKDINWALNATLSTNLIDLKRGYVTRVSIKLHTHLHNGSVRHSYSTVVWLAESKQLAVYVCSLLAWLTFRSWRGIRFVPPKTMDMLQTTRSCNAHDRTLHSHRCENLKFISKIFTTYSLQIIRLSVCPSIHPSMALRPFFRALAAFSFSSSFTQSVGLLGRRISTPQGRYLHYIFVV